MQVPPENDRALPGPQTVKDGSVSGIDVLQEPPFAGSHDYV